MRMLSIHFYFETIDRDVISGRFMKCGIIVSHCVRRYQICIIFRLRYIFNHMIKVSDLNLEWSGQGSVPDCPSITFETTFWNNSEIYLLLSSKQQQIHT